jgi:transcriptional regulator with XRE-family HTH domain
MANERLRLEIAKMGLTTGELAQKIEVDPKTVERWITRGRVPRPRQRAAVAKLLGIKELILWPEIADGPQGQTARQAEVVRIYTHRGELPAGYWYELIQNAKRNIDILVFSGLFLPDGHTDLGKMLAVKAGEGVEIRYLLGDPNGEAIKLRGDEEQVGDHLAARSDLALGYLKAAFDVLGVRIHHHDTTLYNSIYRFDDDALINPHAYGAPAGDSPILHLRRVEGGRLFDHYMESFERVWATSKRAKVSSSRRRVKARS